MMKKKLIIAVLLLSISSVFAQHEKIKALKTAYITSELNLTSNEAEKFWPIYNLSQKKTHQLRVKLRGIHMKIDQNFETISEEEANEILKNSMTLKHKMHEEQTALVRNLTGVLSAKKIIQLLKAEDQFKRKLLRKFKDRKPPSNRNSNSRG
ncbi:MAG: sensor of ECF-type sigma factor [Flavobacteriaceae bacterium]